MKKLFAMILVLCMICGVAALASEMPADPPTTEYDQGDIAAGNNPTTTIKVTIGEVYIVKIPTELSIGYGAPDTPLTISVTDIHLNAGRELIVTPANSGDLTHIDDTSATIPYTVKAGDSGSLAFTANGEQSVSINIEKTAWQAAKTGDYEGDLTFTVGVQDITQP